MMMDDVRDLLQRGVQGLEPRGDGAQSVRAAAARRRTRSRIVTAVTALLVAGVAIGWAITVLEDSRHSVPAGHHAPSGPLDLRALERAWTGHEPDANSLSLVMQDDRYLYVPGEEGVAAYRKDCTHPCARAWRARTPGTTSLNKRMTVGAGFVFVTSERGLYAFRSDCAANGAYCSPLWTAEAPAGAHGFTGPTVSGNTIRVLYSEGAIGHSFHSYAAAFPVDCRTDGGVCDPTWIGDVGPGPLYPGVAQDGVFYQQAGDRMTGFAANCATGGDHCAPVFSIPAPARPRSNAQILNGPVAVDGEAIVSSGDGNVYAYALGCGEDCKPLWVGHVGDFLDAKPIVAGGVVVVSDNEQVLAFPLHCGTHGAECKPQWRAARSHYAHVEYADSGYVVTVIHSRDPEVSVFPADCRGTCAPIWSAKTGVDIQGAVASDGQSVFVGLRGGTVQAFPLDCSDPCDPVWTRTVGDGDVLLMLIDGSGLYVESAIGEFPEQMTVRLSAFRVASVVSPTDVQPSQTAALEARISCRSDGSTQISSPVVQARADGVHLHVENNSGEPVSVNGFGVDVSPGSSDQVVSTPPGHVQVACWPYSQHKGKEPATQDVAVLDPNGLWVSPDLQCPKGDMVGETIYDFIEGSNGSSDPVDAENEVRRLAGVTPADTIQRTGYPRAQGLGFRIVRDSHVVATASFERLNGGYAMSGGSFCSSSGITL